MTPAFVKAFSKRFRCEHCGAQKLNGYSLCARHLIKARRWWRNRVRRKMVLGECVNCQRRHVRGEQRCRLHKEINRKRIHDWQQLKYWSRRRDGLCVECLIGQAQPAVPGSCWCAPHRARRLARLRREKRS